MNQATTKAMTAASAAGAPRYTPVLSIGVGGIAATTPSATLSTKQQWVETSIAIMKMVKTVASMATLDQELSK